METVELHNITIYIAQLLFAAAFLFSLARLIIGPDVTDRILSLDLIAGILLTFTLFQSMYQDQIFFINVSLSLAIISFLSTVAIARYLEFSITKKHLAEKN